MADVPDEARDVTALLADIVGDRPAAEHMDILASLLHRTAVELNKLTRAQAKATMGQPEWGTWAGLQNTTRGLILQASTCRDLVKKLPRAGGG